MKHDFTKPGYYRTLRGEKVYVPDLPKSLLDAIRAKLQDDECFVPVIEDDGGLYWVSATGRYYHNLPDSRDLIEPWRDPVVVEGFVCVYPEAGEFLLWKTRQEAYRCKNHSALRRIRYTEGQGITDITDEVVS
jgi:hypothetical protein